MRVQNINGLDAYRTSASNLDTNSSHCRWKQPKNAWTWGSSQGNRCPSPVFGGLCHLDILSGSRVDVFCQTPGCWMSHGIAGSHRFCWHSIAKCPLLGTFGRSCGGMEKHCDNVQQDPFWSFFVFFLVYRLTGRF